MLYGSVSPPAPHLDSISEKPALHRSLLSKRNMSVGLTVKPSSQTSEDVTENDELIPAITCQHEACEISQSIEQLSPSVSVRIVFPLSTTYGPAVLWTDNRKERIVE
ncbi:hypothetical protein TNCV_3976051 [Trichonephila clavipes]|nr:hypothetical protein TNCV_3976051 [Trichonephila clavipes]